MSTHPVSPEVAGAVAAFFTGGSGPRHSVLSRIFDRTGFGDVAPYRPPDLEPNKENRVRETILTATKQTQRARELMDGLFAEMRVAACFSPDPDPEAERLRRDRVRMTQAAFARIDWELTDEGVLRPVALGAVAGAVGRPAIEDQLERLRRATDDPALLLGTAKEMLETTAKYVLEAFAVPYSPSISFDELWFHARDRLSLHPRDVDVTVAGGKEVREILEASWSIARMTNELRKSEGTGHGRTLPTGVSPEMALLVVREACSVAQLVLSALDRRLGR